jgi:hypothetical protein
MNAFDVAIVAVIALSALFAFARGIIREVIALGAWVVGSSPRSRTPEHLQTRSRGST